MRASGFVGLLGSVVVLACANQAAPIAREPNGEVQPAGGKGESTTPRVNQASEAPLETAPPNVPEFEPAFPEQTRASAMQTETPLRISEIAGGFKQPWALEFLPDGRMLVTEKHAGRLLLVTRDGRKSPPVENVPEVDGGNQGGLMDVIVAPDYDSSRNIYLSYYEPRDDGNGLAVARAKLLDENPPRLDSVQVIFRMQPTMDSDKHAGGRMVFTPDGNLFVTLGDRQTPEGRHQARDLNSHLGKVVRIRPDGSVPDDNPFANRSDAKPEIWSYGHRNILAADLDDQGRLWVVEMGPRGGDELNLVERGKDYGWPTIGYGEEYSGEAIHQSPAAPGLEQPVYYWDPVISPGALTIYSGDVLPEWKGDFLIAGLSSKALVRLRLKDDLVVGEERLLTDRDERIREVVQGPDGAVYLLTDGNDASLLKLTPGRAQ